MRKWTRMIRRVAVFALLGFIVNILALLVVSYLPWGEWKIRRDTSGVSVIHSPDGRWWWVRWQESVGTSWVLWCDEIEADVVEVIYGRLPQSLPGSMPVDLNLAAAYPRTQGWPFRCAWACWLVEPSGPFAPVQPRAAAPRDGFYFSDEGLLLLREEQVTGFASSRWWKSGITLPIRPIWPGLLLNTAFYGVIVWMLWFTMGLVRRNTRARRRRRHGLCVGCGYDLRGGAIGSLCPECGEGSS